ncbi:MAG: Mrp/NBP35 family ATP-binding protein [Rhodothermales bacterium]
MAVSKEQVYRALSNVVEPDRGKDILRLNMVKGLKVEANRVSFTVILKDPSASFADSVADRCLAAVREEAGDDVEVDVQVDNEMISLEMSDDGGKKEAQPEDVVNFIAVASGKGGVGKSTVAANLAVALKQMGYDVGLVDTDIYGPSVPTMFGVGDEKPRVNDRKKIVPLERHGIKLLSMGMMVDPAKAVIWRGPMVSNAVRQFLGECEWGELDYLILDLPPGTGDIQLTIVQTVALTGAVVVSTPQNVALADARKGVSMFENVDVPVLGIVENMAYFTPPELPDKKYYLFGREGARRLADELDVPFLAEVPIEQRLRETGDEGTPMVVTEPDSLSARAFTTMAERVVQQVIMRNAEQESTQKVEILHK